MFHTVLHATPFFVFILCLHTNWISLFVTLSFPFFPTSDRFVVVLPASVSYLRCGAPVWRSVTVQHSPAHCTAQWSKTSGQKQRPSYIVPQVFRAERAERFKYSELPQHNNNKKQPFSTLTVRWITEEDRNKNAIRGNNPETIRRRGPVCSSSTLTFEKHRRPM